VVFGRTLGQAVVALGGKIGPVPDGIPVISIGGARAAERTRFHVRAVFAGWRGGIVPARAARGRSLVVESCARALLDRCRSGRAPVELAALAAVAYRAWASRTGVSVGAWSPALPQGGSALARLAGHRHHHAVDREHVGAVERQERRAQENAGNGEVGGAARVCNGDLRATI
jgi:hypothetical protein